VPTEPPPAARPVPAARAAPATQETPWNLTAVVVHVVPAPCAALSGIKLVTIANGASTANTASRALSRPCVCVVVDRECVWCLRYALSTVADASDDCKGRESCRYRNWWAHYLLQTLPEKTTCSLVRVFV
jgi:hypothetical protein